MLVVRGSINVMFFGMRVSNDLSLCNPMWLIATHHGTSLGGPQVALEGCSSALGIARARDFG